MPLRNLTIKIVAFVAFVTILSSCSTEKNSFINRGYHNMTAKYNGYFNANVLIDEAMDAYDDKVTEDYNKILAPDLYPSAEDVPGLKPNLDTAISKCTKVIVKHSMPSVEKVTNKSNEYCSWIDDNWFVIGYANYIKRDYEEAVEKLKFVADNKAYKDDESRYISRIFLAKTYTAMGKFRMAQKQLDLVNKAIEGTAERKEAKKDRERPKSKYQRQKAKERRKEAKKNRPVDFPKKWKVDYEAAAAELYIAKEEYKKAIEHLEKAIDMCPWWERKRKARYTFVLAQLYREVGNGSQASFHFNEVVHSPAKYTMRFQAQIKKALSATSGNNTIAKELKKLLKDPKNAEFKDQIFYALAELEVKEGNMEMAKEYFSASVLWSIKNDRQKGVSYLRLGNISFDEKDYVAAQKYYDSCIQVLPEEYEGYDAVKGKAEGLTDLVEHYETFVFEDSVQRIGNMPEKEREKFLKETLKQMKEEEAKRKAAEEARLLAQQERLNNQVSNSGSGSKWYFYNQKIKGSGFNDFRSLWGQRENEDDWRRSTKRSPSQFNEDVDESDSADVATQDVDSLSVDDLRKNIPLTDSSMTASIDRLMNSMYMLGIIYKEQLKEINEATLYFQKVVDKGVEHPKVLPALYQLYLIKKGSGGDEYKRRILTEYPNSEIAQIINDPGYLKEKEEKEKADYNLYSSTYEDYRFRRYRKVLAVCDTVINNDTTNQFLNKYYLLKAFCLSYLKNGNQAAISQPLKELIALDPESPEGKQAKIYLGQLAMGENITDNSISQTSDYVVDDDSKHYFVIVFPANAEDYAKSKIKLSNFNRKFFSTEDLDIVSSPLASASQIIRVKTFDNKQKAKEFYDTYNSAAAKSILTDMPEKYDHFIINLENFKRLSTQGDVSGYMGFFSQNYQ